MIARCSINQRSARRVGRCVVVSSWDAFREEVRRALEAFATGDAAPYKKCWSGGDDCTVFGAFGGVVQGGSEIETRLDWAAAQYREGRYTRYEVLAEFMGTDVGCIVALERVETLDKEGLVMVRERRLTHVARQERHGWRIVHQHSDPLVTVKPPAG
jgi:ketosteroid isomerase-like protein